MYESSLGKVLRLSVTPVRPYQRVQNGRLVSVHQYQQARTTGVKLGKPYTESWGNVSTGQVVQFGNELWKVIPATAYPGYKPPTKSSGSTSSGTGKATGGSTTGTGGASSSSSASKSSGPATSTLYLQNLFNLKKYDKLTMPSNYVVTVVPVLP